MKIRMFCTFVALAVLSLGTMAYADTFGTITQVLFYPGTGGPIGGTGTSSQNYTPASVAHPNGTGLVTATWTASYTFNQYGFYAGSLPGGATFVNLSVTAVDTETGTITLSQSSGTDGYYAYDVGTTDNFTTDPAFNNTFIFDQTQAAGSIGGTSAACQGNPSLNANGSTDAQGCVDLRASGSAVTKSGFNNTVMNDSTGSGPSGADGSGNLVNSNFTGAGTVTLYEQVKGIAGIQGTSPDSDTPNSSSAATELVLVYTYDIPGPNNTPEPGTLLLLGTGLSFVASRLRKSAVK